MSCFYSFKYTADNKLHEAWIPMDTAERQQAALSFHASRIVSFSSFIQDIRDLTSLKQRNRVGVTFDSCCQLH